MKNFNLWALGLHGVVIRLAPGKAGGFDSHKVHHKEFDMKDIKVKHKFRGEGVITERCIVLQLLNPDTTSIFVEFEKGEPEEVTKSLVEIINE